MSSFPHNNWLFELLAELDTLPPLSLPFDGLGEGLRFGAFAGKALEVGADVEESRPYQQGDPVRLINWRLTARTQDQVFVKYQPKPTELRAKLLIDLRASTWQGTRSRLKSEQIVRIAFRLAQALSESVVVDTQVWSSIPESLPILRGRARWGSWTDAFYSSLLSIVELDASHEPPLSEALTQLNDQWVVVISDFVDWDEQLESLLLNARDGRQLLLIQVLDQAELNLPILSGIGLGTSGFSADSAHHHAYQTAMSHYLAHISNWCADINLNYWRIVSTESLDTL